MAILFRLLDGDVEVEPPQRGPELSEALQHYLWPLSRSGQFTANLAVLRGLDPYDDATFTGAQLAALEDVTRQFRDELTVTPKESLPPMPSYFDEQRVAREPMSKERILQFLDELITAASSARERSLVLQALGD